MDKDQVFAGIDDLVEDVDWIIADTVKFTAFGVLVLNMAGQTPEGLTIIGVSAVAAVVSNFVTLSLGMD